ncbi:MAG TPA: NAD+ synthase, partial [Rhodospirillales bacterium]|nr:NAD+ synthase [Rhodospirillales bacterium]
MRKTLHIALAQINPTVGDVPGNIEVIRSARDRAARDGAHLVVCGELALSGYPPEDLVLKDAFLQRIEEGVAQLAEDTGGGAPAILLGAPWRRGGRLYNAALLLEGGTVKAVRCKHDLPNYGVFDEKRIFSSGPLPDPVTCRGVRLGVMVCEDMWTPDAAEYLAGEGAEVLIVLNGSPFEMGKTGTRL